MVRVHSSRTNGIRTSFPCKSRTRSITRFASRQASLNSTAQKPKPFAVNSLRAAFSNIASYVVPSSKSLDGSRQPRPVLSRTGTVRPSEMRVVYNMEERKTPRIRSSSSLRTGSLPRSTAEVRLSIVSSADEERVEFHAADYDTRRN